MNLEIDLLRDKTTICVKASITMIIMRMTSEAHLF